MGLTTTSRTRNFLASGGALVVLSVVIIVTTYGSGPYFPPPLIFTWPMLILGGALVGYGIAGQMSIGERRPLRIGLGVIGGILGWIGQIWITTLLNPAVDLVPSIENQYPVSASMAIFAIILVELWMSRLSSLRT